MLALVIFGRGKYFVTACIFVSQLNMAYNDTVIDALMNQACNKGKEDGSQYLNANAFLYQAVGAISGAVIAMYYQDHSR